MKTVTIAQLLKAIAQVETGGQALPDACYRKDGKTFARGAFQIHKTYWEDVVKYGGACFPYAWKAAHNRRRATLAVMIYWVRYGGLRCLDFQFPISMKTAEKLARIHNGGPRGHKKKATLPYCRKVKAELEKGAVE